MAKKKAAKSAAGELPVVSSLAPPKLKKGYKRCPHCSAEIAARSATCPECQKPIPPKNKKGKSNGPKGKPGRKPGKAAVAANGPTDLIGAAAAFVRAAGGIAKAQAALAGLAQIAGAGN